MSASQLPLSLAAREQDGARHLPGSAVASLYPRMALEKLLVGHRGCVNHVQFNDSGMEHLKDMTSCPAVCKGSQ
jgi:hypothetical protein